MPPIDVLKLLIKLATWMGLTLLKVITPSTLTKTTTEARALLVGHPSYTYTLLFFDLPCLERLYLSGNRIEKITENFGKFPTSLRVLALRDNKINSIHPDISKYDL